MERKFDVIHRVSGRKADDAWVLIPSRDQAAWVAARVYASICEPSLARELRKILQETHKSGIVLGEQGRKNDPYVRGARLALRIFLAAIEAIRNGQGELIERVAKGIHDRLAPRDAESGTGADAVDDKLLERIRTRLREFEPCEVISVEHVVRIVGGGPLAIDSILQGLADRHELVERFGELTYRKR